jgi:ATP-dependent protease HslVU (ClpYQ) ATPase subunit
MTDFSHRKIVSELDRFIVGQTEAKANRPNSS